MTCNRPRVWREKRLNLFKMYKRKPLTLCVCIAICKPFDSSPVDECKSRGCLAGLKETAPVFAPCENLGNVVMENVFLIATMMGECKLLEFKCYRVMGAGVLNVLQ